MSRTAPVVVAAFFALASAPAASSHGPAQSPGYVSTVVEIRPPVLGLTARVLDGDELLSLRNWTNETVVVLGPDGAPMLRFTRDGISRRTASGWRLLERGTGYAWHDPRIHWNGDEPPAVAAAPDRPHRIASWRIRIVANGKPATIRGFIGWAPVPVAAAGAEDKLSAWVDAAVVVGSVVTLAALTVPLLLLRRRPTP